MPALLIFHPAGRIMARIRKNQIQERPDMEWCVLADDQRLKDFKPPPAGSPLSPQEAKALAADVALFGAGHVGANPMVGAVAVDRDHNFLAYGAHLKSGEGHAEARMIASLESTGRAGQLEGGTVYVTLEPCSFWGKTPSCAVLLSRYPLRQVIYGGVDTHPKVNGKGAAILEGAGIPCIQDREFARLSQTLAERSLWSVRRRMPFVGMKAAVTLNGIFAFDRSERHWISCQRSRDYGHWLRQLYDAILVGPKTLSLDNPGLDVRVELPVLASHPVRIVLDPEATALCSHAPDNIRLLRLEPEKVIWVFAQGKARSALARERIRILEGMGVQTVFLPTEPQSGFLPQELLNNLFQRRISSLLLEGGAGIWNSFLNHAMVQKIHLFQSLSLLPGEGRLWAEGCSLGRKIVADPSSVRLVPMGQDLLTEALLVGRG